ncbi:FAD linked oxidase domain-containing protein [Gemmatirosa kalamazoonensis]|uniref:FAD linked oxidase domain-containing protein n=1 Tax=Gemmatirosa kalamazoonensis TaxID=861299 RepID=W0RGZ9_9BACT|nr:FAD-binding protein [Gemmatirosa kalamazoonensis]AHG90061.1 FAD linked oxidase domain-containing protein [Gemmatirosa kalamazoonensis]
MSAATESVAPPPVGAPNDTADVASLVRDAAARGTRLRLVGAGTWLDAGRPVTADASLPLDRLSGVVDYVPGDLTLTARAATPLAEIARVTAAERQLLALDPFGEGTLGATVATASAGPLAHAFGTPRDNVLGLTFVDGSGEIVRAGGRVVKNVAGFDLVRLLTGAWGTLGALTEITVRLRPMPELDVTVAAPLPSTHALQPFLARLRAAPLSAWALELANAPLAEHLGLVKRPLLLARLAGNEALVRAQRATLADLAGVGDVADVGSDVWRRLRAVEPAVATVVRVSARPSRLAALCAQLFSPAAGAFGVLAHASVERGIARLILPGDAGFGLPRFDVGDAAPAVVVERLPASLWAEHGAHLAPPREPDRLTLGVRRAFDPHGILNPGIL